MSRSRTTPSSPEGIRTQDLFLERPAFAHLLGAQGDTRVDGDQAARVDDDRVQIEALPLFRPAK